MIAATWGRTSDQQKIKRIRMSGRLSTPEKQQWERTILDRVDIEREQPRLSTESIVCKIDIMMGSLLSTVGETDKQKHK